MARSAQWCTGKRGSGIPGIPLLALALALALAAGAAGAEEPSRRLTPGPSAAAAERVWRGGGELPERVARTRNAALDAGMWNLDPAARALLLAEELGAPLERARLAADLAPGLADAHLARAGAELRHARDPIAAAAGLRAAAAALLGGSESAAWWRASWSTAAVLALAWGSLGFLLVAAFATLPFAARHLAGRLPMPSAAAALAALLLLPAALGEGLLGIGLVAVALSCCFGRPSHRACAVGAAALAGVALYPGAEFSAAAVGRLGGTPLLESVLNVERGVPTRLDAQRIERDAERAADARALLARRRGDLGEADRLYAALLAADELPLPSRYNNAANTKIALGEIDAAIALYEEVTRVQPSPWVLFNLSQAYGQRILLEEQDAALADAQFLDEGVVHALTERVGLNGGKGVIDLPGPLPEEPREATGALAASVRARFAPGWLGASPLHAGIGLAAAVGVGLLAGTRLGRERGGHDLYAGIARLLQGREATDPTLRMERLAALRAQQRRVDQVQLAAAWLVPGAAGAIYGRPLLGLLGALSAAAALAFASLRDGVVPDALVAGHTGAVLLGLVAAASALAYLLLLAVALWAREPD